ncbi:MAG: translation initiation factor IF-2 N-terminal domain-containing protein [Bacillus subtilis]|nr:translation initiation factor IF-2 N-terminal domain-containing protein [Bacillus subtilis]
MTAERVRVYDLAKQLKLPNKEVMDLLAEKLNVKVKSHASTIEKVDADKLVNLLNSKSAPAQEQKASPRPSSPMPEAKTVVEKPKEQAQERKNFKNLLQTIKKPIEDPNTEIPFTLKENRTLNKDKGLVMIIRGIGILEETIKGRTDLQDLNRMENIDQDRLIIKVSSRKDKDLTIDLVQDRLIIKVNNRKDKDLTIGLEQDRLIIKVNNRKDKDLTIDLVQDRLIIKVSNRKGKDLTIDLVQDLKMADKEDFLTGLINQDKVIDLHLTGQVKDPCGKQRWRTSKRRA